MTFYNRLETDLSYRKTRNMCVCVYRHDTTSMAISPR